jgi:hypothetical protein
VAPGQVVLLENCRVNVGEKKNKEELARKMAALCDIFVNDAFGTAHRAEGTTYGIAQYAPIACAGPLLSAEIDALTKALAHPQRPLAAIVAGSKVSTKLTILQSLADKVDQLIVGGGIANTFMLAAGLPIGKSLAEPDLLDAAKAVMAAMKARGAEVPIPTDVVTAKTFAADAPATVKAATDVAEDDLILDIGPETAARLAAQLKSAGTIVWNGPVGVFEFAAFENGTKQIAQAIAESPPSALPAVATPWRPLPSTASRSRWATSPPAAALSWKCWKARPCPRSRFWKSAHILAIDRIAQIHAQIPNTHLVMHGSSSVPQEWLAIIRQYGGDLKETYGVPVEEIQRGIKSGVRKVNIDTDIRLAMTGAMRQSFAQNPSEFDPRKSLIAARKAAMGICKLRFEAFGCAGMGSKIKPVHLDVMAGRY